MINTSLFVDRAGVIRPDLIPLAAFLCAEEYDDYARSIILDHAAAGAPLADLTVPTPEGWVVLEPHDLAGAVEALARGGPAPAVEDRPAPAPVAGGAPSLADQVAVEADRLRRSASPIAGFLADQLERVAQLVRWTGATTPEEHEARIEVWEESAREHAYEMGRQAGQAETTEYWVHGPCGRPLDPTGRSLSR
jgi:hypothetical protein